MHFIKIQKIPEPKDISTVPIPDWIRKNASWWSEELISDETFLLGIDYLVEKGIIKV